MTLLKLCFFCGEDHFTQKLSPHFKLQYNVMRSDKIVLIFRFSSIIFQGKSAASRTSIPIYRPALSVSVLNPLLGLSFFAEEATTPLQPPHFRCSLSTPLSSDLPSAAICSTHASNVIQQQTTPTSPSYSPLKYSDVNVNTRGMPSRDVKLSCALVINATFSA